MAACDHCVLHQRLARRCALYSQPQTCVCLSYLLSYLDRTGERYLHIAVPWWAVILGYIIGVSTMVTGARYVTMVRSLLVPQYPFSYRYTDTSRIGKFLMAIGYAGFALTAVWVSNAIPRPPAKRAAAIGIVNGFGNLGNL